MSSKENADLKRHLDNKMGSIDIEPQKGIAQSRELLIPASKEYDCQQLSERPDGRDLQLVEPTPEFRG